MENKINIAELLKDCHSGMELDCTIYEDVTLYEISDSPENEYPIRIETKNGYFLDLTKYGTYTDIEEAKCVIFPKGKTTWEGFQRPFKDGDIVFYNDTIAIFKEWGDETLFRAYVIKYLYNNHAIVRDTPLFGKSIRREVRLATEEEKQKFFQVIEDNGYKWNAETKTLEEVIKPKFNIGDKVSSKYLKNRIIEKAEWESCINRVIYKLKGLGWYSAEELQSYKEKNMGAKETLVQIDLTRKMNVNDEIEVILGDYEFVLKDGKTYFVKKQSQYPKTYEECCKNVFGLVHEGMTVDLPMHYSPLLIAFTKLLICRDAYWKVYGEYMGLRKPWEPDWKDNSDKYFICYLKDELWMSNVRDCNRFLVFPSAEMRDTFYENFRELIEDCKELL